MSANHPHDASRPESAAVRKALASDDVEALRIALSHRQRRFAEEYIFDFNGSAAALRAGYSTNYPDRQAHLLLKHKGVIRYIESLSESKTAKIVSVNPDYVLQRVTEIISKEGARDGDRLRGLELLARHLGMFIDRTELTGKDGGAIEIEQRKVDEEAQKFTDLIKGMRNRVQSDKKDVTIV